MSDSKKPETLKNYNNYKSKKAYGSKNIKYVAKLDIGFKNDFNYVIYCWKNMVILYIVVGASNASLSP